MPCQLFIRGRRQRASRRVAADSACCLCRPSFGKCCGASPARTSSLPPDAPTSRPERSMSAQIRSGRRRRSTSRPLRDSLWAHPIDRSANGLVKRGPPVSTSVRRRGLSDGQTLPVRRGSPSISKMAPGWRAVGHLGRAQGDAVLQCSWPHHGVRWYMALPDGCWWNEDW